jgi:hypothetical protein
VAAVIAAARSKLVIGLEALDMVTQGRATDSWAERYPSGWFLVLSAWVYFGKGIVIVNVHRVAEDLDIKASETHHQALV